MKKTRLSIQLEPQLAETLQKEAQKEGLSMAAHIRRKLIKYYELQNQCGNCGLKRSVGEAVNSGDGSYRP